MNELCHRLERAYGMLEHARNAGEIDALNALIYHMEQGAIDAARANPDAALAMPVDGLSDRMVEFRECLHANARIAIGYPPLSLEDSRCGRESLAAIPE